MEVRKLQLGDFLWIAKEKFGEQKQTLLEYGIEEIFDFSNYTC